jgi:hypothetical protein
MPNQVDPIEKDKRIRTIMEWIIDDFPYSDMVSNIVTKWNLSVRHAKRYIADARKKWNKEDDVMIEHKRRLKIESLKKLKRSLLESYKGTPHGIRSILAVEKQIILLENLDHPKKRELTGRNGAPLNPEPKPIESNVDYSLLPDDVLQQIVKARKKLSTE